MAVVLKYLPYVWIFSMIIRYAVRNSMKLKVGHDHWNKCTFPAKKNINVVCLCRCSFFPTDTRTCTDRTWIQKTKYTWKFIYLFVENCFYPVLYRLCLFPLERFTFFGLVLNDLFERIKMCGNICANSVEDTFKLSQKWLAQVFPLLFTLVMHPLYLYRKCFALLQTIQCTQHARLCFVVFSPLPFSNVFSLLFLFRLRVGRCRIRLS